jgi:capsular polysaccharide biosynthesis protein
MRQETLGLSRFLPLVRRVWAYVGEVAVVSLAAGIVFAALHPPMLTSTALVVLPQNAQGSPAAANGGIDSYTATQEVIATSTPVLTNALPHVRPPVSLAELRREIQVGSLTPYVISISARGTVAADAEATANAVANSYISYIGSKNSPVGPPVLANLLQLATSASGRSLPVSLLITGGFSALYGVIVGAICALAFDWADRRFRISR